MNNQQKKQQESDEQLPDVSDETRKPGRVKRKSTYLEDYV